jgi:WD40 repeat protein
VWRRMCEACFGSEVQLNLQSDWEFFYQTLYRREMNWKKGKARLKELLGHRTKVVMKAKDHLLASGSYDRCIKVWNMITQECELSISNTHTVSCIDFLSEDSVIASGSYNR